MLLIYCSNGTGIMEERLTNLEDSLAEFQAQRAQDSQKLDRMTELIQSLARRNNNASPAKASSEVCTSSTSRTTPRLSAGLRRWSQRSAASASISMLTYHLCASAWTPPDK